MVASSLVIIGLLGFWMTYLQYKVSNITKIKFTISDNTSTGTPKQTNSSNKSWRRY